MDLRFPLFQPSFSCLLDRADDRSLLSALILSLFVVKRLEKTRVPEVYFLSPVTFLSEKAGVAVLPPSVIFFSFLLLLVGTYQTTRKVSGSPCTRVGSPLPPY